MTNEKIRGHKLLTAQLRANLPKFYATENDTDPIARVKFFTPDSSWYWYVIEFDGQDALYCLVFGPYVETGYVSLSYLEALRGPWGLPVERDLAFEPKRLSAIKREHQAREGEIRHY
jgi:hypothetical protein